MWCSFKYLAIFLAVYPLFDASQNILQTSHYEFMCKSHQIPVIYCAEQFSDENTMPTLVMKAFKRTMAAEYSRELSAKVSVGKKNLAEKGFWLTGSPGIGFRRMMISPDGQHRMVFMKGSKKH
jgi:hypothetical protein